MSNPNTIISSSPSSARRILFELQVEQHHHDEVYHREIARLSLHQRLNHMALHFAKYTGKVATADEDCVPVYTDFLIIVLSTANVLNAELWELLELGDQEYAGLLGLGRAIAIQESPALENPQALLRATAIAAGRVAAACEKIDHLEEVSFRSEVKAGIARLARLSLAVLAQQGKDPGDVVKERLAGVKQRLKLHGRI